MVCYLHDPRPVVVSCSQCRQALCRDCSQLHRPPLCGDCIAESCGAEQTAILRRAMFALGLGITFALVMTLALSALYRTHVPHVWLLQYLRATVLSFGRPLVLLVSLVGLGAPYGYRVFGAVKYPRGYFIPVSMFFSLIQFRIIAAALFGPLIFPFGVIADIRRYRANRRLLDQTTSMLQQYRATPVSVLSTASPPKALQRGRRVP